MAGKAEILVYPGVFISSGNDVEVELNCRSSVFFPIAISDFSGAIYLKFCFNNERRESHEKENCFAIFNTSKTFFWYFPSLLISSKPDFSLWQHTLTH